VNDEDFAQAPRSETKLMEKTVKAISLDLESLEQSLAGKLIGHKIIYHPETGSTNDDAFELGCSGAPEGTVVIAEKQRFGKGRR